VCCDNLKKESPRGEDLDFDDFTFDRFSKEITGTLSGERCAHCCQ
jgi:hypothetical protein